MAGELEEPGWPNLHTPGMPSPGEAFISAFQHAQAIKNQRMMIEGKIHELGIKNMLMEQNFEQRERQMDINATLRTMQFNRQIQAMEQNAYFKDRQLQVGEFKNWWLQSEHDKKEAATAEMLSEANKLKLDDPNFTKNMYNIQTDPKYADVPAIIRNQLMKTHADKFNENVRKQFDLYNIERKALATDLGAKDLSPLAHPELWSSKDVKTPGTKWVRGNINPNYQAGATDEIRKDPYQFITKPQKDIDALVKRYQRLEEMRSKIPDQINDPSIGAYAAPAGTSQQATTMMQRAKMRLTDPNASADSIAGAQKYIRDHPDEE